MADGANLPEIVRRTMEANTRLYRGWLELSLDYFRGITEIFDPDGRVAEQQDELEPELGALILEAEGGKIAKGAFLVTNDLGRELKCMLTASTFADANEKTLRPKFSFEPASVTLAPGQQEVVHASVAVGRTWELGAALTGEFGIKGMGGFSVPVVLRRLDAVDASATNESPIDELPAAKKQKAAKPKRSGAKKAPRKRVAKK